jgi:dihydrofolate synthase/folylpolyglutamate synthase
LTLDAWLAHWTALHGQAIVLGLERVAAVAARMGLGRPAPLCITVGGTNGKGSTVAFLDAILRRSGRGVGCYTSPHLLAYNERVRIDGVAVDDAELCAAFRRIEAARDGVPLTYFEAGTLAALLVFEAREVDVAVLEVGLGGRLDAVNLVDADAAIVTTVDLDHQEFLGPDRESIGREKAGIFRAGRPAVVGDDEPPASLLQHAAQVGAVLLRAGIDFRIEAGAAAGWRLVHADGGTIDLPQPGLAGTVQRRNAACAVAALHALRDVLPLAPAAIAQGVADARCAGRLQRIADAPATIADVAHNPQAARELAHWLDGLPAAPSAAVFAALGDKDIDGIADALRGRFAYWHVAGLAGESPRGLDVDATVQRLARAGIAAQPAASVAAALVAARAAVGVDGRVVAFGSFLTVAAAMRAAGLHAA